MTKQKKSIEDRFFPVANIPKFNQLTKPVENQSVIKKIIQGAIQSAYHMKLPDSYELTYKKDKLPEMVATEEQIQMVTHLIEALEPQNAIEATLAVQYVITFIRGLEIAKGEGRCSVETAIGMFEFGHQVLETLQKYRSKGAQQISVQYNVNQGQVVNIKNSREKEQPIILEEE